MTVYNLDNISYSGMVVFDGRQYVAGRVPPPVHVSEHYPDIPESIPQNMQRYVGGAGADDLNDGTQGSPWATFNYALQQMAESAAGEFYCLNLGGDITVDAFIDTKFYGDGNGSLNQFMIIRPDPALPSPPTLTLNARVEIDGQEYWLWSNYNQAGSEGINIGEDTLTTHHTFRGITGAMTGTGGDNHGFFQALNSNADYFGVINCDLTGPGSFASGVHGNTSCIIAFGTPNLRWSNNTVRNAPRDMYFKHGNVDGSGPGGIYIEYNYQKGQPAGGISGCAFAGRKNGGEAFIRHNIFDQTVLIGNDGGGPQVEGYDIENNTFGGLMSLNHVNDRTVGCNLKNNYFGDRLEILPFQDVPDPDSDNTTDYNQHAADSITHERVTYTLAEWRVDGPPGGQSANGVVGLAAFAGGQTLENVADYEMIGGNGLSAGDDGRNVGANVLRVGVQ